MKGWIAALVALAAVRVAIPLAALAAEGSQLPGLPRYEFVAQTGDATGFYAATREFMAAWGRLPVVVVAVLAAAVIAGTVLTARLWRRHPQRRAWIAAGAALGASLVVAAAISQMEPSGAAVFGWPLVWSLPMLPYRALGGPLDPRIAFGFGLPLLLAANVVTVVATAYAGLHATGRRTLGLVAAALFAFWPLLLGLIGGSRAWGNGTWTVDAGLHLYTEPLSTALVTVALALLLAPSRSDLHLALAGLALGFAATVKLSNGLVAAAGAAILAIALGPRRASPYVAGAVASAPILVAFWPLGYAEQYERGINRPPDLFALHHAGASWTESLLWTPRTLAIVLPLALIGALVLRRDLRLALLLAWTLVNAAFYSFFFYTAVHPRFLFASLPALFILTAAGGAALASHVRRAPVRRNAATDDQAR